MKSEMRIKVEHLLESDISGYKIGLDNPDVAQEMISRLRTGRAKISNLHFHTVEKLEQAHDFYFGSEYKGKY